MVAESLFCVLLNFTFGYFFHLVWKSCRLFSSVASLGIVVLVKRILILRFAAYTFCASLGVFTQYLFSIDQILLDGSSIGLGSFWFGVLLTRERRESCISFLVSSGDLVVSNYAFDIFDSDTAHWVLKVFVASRLNVTGAWQIPQGVTEDREDSKSAAIRELWEETGITSAEIIAKVPQWLTYDFPLAVKVKVNSLWGGEWHGQAQTRKRFLMRFTHAEIEINLATGEAEAEFSMWKWAIPEEAVDYKRPTYEEEVRKMMVAKLLNANQQKGESCACCLHTVLIPYTGIQSFVSSLYMNLSAKICIYRLVI
ncbi:hypothetical protein P3L10_031382 [Capsicum annuum]